MTPENILEQAYISLASRDYEKAITFYDRYLEIAPDCYNVWFNRGNAFLGLGQHYNAIASYAEALEINPYHLSTWLNKGIAWTELRRYEQAISSIDTALKINPDHYAAWFNKAIVLKELGDEKEQDVLKKLERLEIVNIVGTNYRYKNK